MASDEIQSDKVLQNESLRPEKHTIEKSFEDEEITQDANHKRIKLNPSESIVVSESDVGIIAYVNPNLEPIQGGIIKQRYSDFHVREVARGGKVCKVESLLPSPSYDDGSGGDGKLHCLVEKFLAESNDRTGQLKRQRLAEEEKEKRAAREVQQEQKRQEAEGKRWIWNANEEQTLKLVSLLGQDGSESLKKLYTEGPKDKTEGKDERQVHTLPLSDKQQRTEVHQLVREICKGSLVTETFELPRIIEDEKGVKSTTIDSLIKIKWGTGKSSEQRGMNKDNSKFRSSDENAPPYIHFLLHKTNRDNQDALNILARSLGLLNNGRDGKQRGGNKAVKEITVAGTKDKRAITVQQVALKRGKKTVDDVWRMANGIRRGYEMGSGKELVDAVNRRGDRGIRISNIRYGNSQLHLGELEGNEFEIVLRNLKVNNNRTIVDSAVEVLKTKGFINYYGMQRFGTSTISTHKVGIELLKGDYKSAVQLIMSPRQGDDEIVRQARIAFQNGDLDRSLSLFPHFHVPERSIIMRMRPDRHIFSQGDDPFSVVGADWKKYFSALPRTLRTMYVHAYQSYIWNSIATERVQRFGLEKVVKGDYVIIQSADKQEKPIISIDNDGEQFNMNEEDSADGFQKKQVKLIEDESEACQYTIHDVMIPLPGSEVIIPSISWMSEVYEGILTKDGLKAKDLEEIGKHSSELALTGDYRALLHLPKNVSHELVRYTDPNVNLVQSDEDRILGLEKPPPLIAFEDELEQTSFVALIIRFTLGVSAYATMALREILKQETGVSHQKEMTQKGEDRKISGI